MKTLQLKGNEINPIDYYNSINHVWNYAFLNEAYIASGYCNVVRHLSAWKQDTGPAFCEEIVS